MLDRTDRPWSCGNGACCVAFVMALRRRRPGALGAAVGAASDLTHSRHQGRFPHALLAAGKGLVRVQGVQTLAPRGLPLDACVLCRARQACWALW